MTGGLGNDLFRFDFLPHGGDLISDYGAVPGDNDRFEISFSAFGGGLLAGPLQAARFQVRADNQAQDANDRFIFRTTDATLWFDVNGSTAGGLSLIADLQAGAVVTSPDILLI